MIKNAQWIIAQGESLIKPFVLDKVRKITSVNEGGNTYVLSMPVDAISFGVSGFGYDLRLSPKQFKVFRHIPGQIINPKKFNPSFLYDAELNHSLDGDYFILPHHSYALGVSLEYINIPDNIEVIFIGKSTYARAGIIVNMTPGEAGWKGHLTIEISNSSDADAMIFANEGICQALFFEGEPTDIVYNDSRKYQDQTEMVTLARV